MPERPQVGPAADSHLPVLKQNLADWQVGLAEAGWNSLYWDNHDQPRAVSRFGDDSPEHRVNSAKTLATVQHLHQGTPYVYQGEELGMTNTYFADIAQYHDIESVNYHADALSLGLEAEAVLHSLSVKSRDNARTPMQWDDTAHAGFTEGIPWLPVNPNYVTINAAAAVADPDSVFHHFKKLIELRHEHPVVVDGRVRAAAGRPRADLGGHPDAGRPGAADGGQLLLGAGDGAGRRAAGRSAAPRCCWPPTRGRARWSWRPGSHASTCVG